MLFLIIYQPGSWDPPCLFPVEGFVQSTHGSHHFMTGSVACALVTMVVLSYNNYYIKMPLGALKIMAHQLHMGPAWRYASMAFDLFLCIYRERNDMSLLMLKIATDELIHAKNFKPK